MRGRDNNHDRRSLAAGVVAAALMIAQQVGAKATRDAFFLSEHGPEQLPQVIVASAVLSLMVAAGMARVLLAMGPQRAASGAFVVSAGLLVGEGLFAHQWPQIVSVVLYLHLGALGPIVISGFWSVVNERFDPHAAKTYIARMGASAAAGGALGGLVAERVTTSFSLLTMLPLLAAMNVLCAVSIPVLGRGASSAGATEDVSASSAPARGLSGYLQKVAALVLLTSTAGGLIDYAVKTEAATAMAEPEQLAAFFAYLHAVLGLLGFVVQSVVSRRLLKTVGLGATVGLLPAVVVLTASCAAIVPRLWTVIVAKAVEAGVRSSAFRSGYELLYIPVQRQEKRAAKTLIDVGADRLGDIFAAGLAIAALRWMPEGLVPFSLVAAVLVSLMGLVFAFALHRGYVAELAASLRSGQLLPEDVGAQDATTAKTVADTMALSRVALLAEIEAIRGHDFAVGERQSPEPSFIAEEDTVTGPNQGAVDHRTAMATPQPPMLAPEGASPGAPVVDQPRARSVLKRAQTLLSGSFEEVNELLGERALEAELLPLMVPWLLAPQTVQRAVGALRRLGEGHEGILTDTLMDVTQPLPVRTMMPRVLKDLPTERARDGLVLGLRSESMVVRYQSARGLAQLCDQHGSLRPHESVIFAALDQPPPPHVREPSIWLASMGARYPEQQLHPYLDYALTLLRVPYDTQVIKLCRTAFSRGDTMMRGTAMEYLEYLLPSEVFTHLQPYMEQVTETEPRPARPPEDIIRDLESSASALVTVDVRSLRDG